MCSMEPAESWGDSPGYQHRMGTPAKGCLLSPLPPTSCTDGGWPLVGTQTSENPATGHMCSLRLRVRRRIGPELTGVSPEFETHPVSMSPPWMEIQGSERVWAGNYGPSSLPVRARWLCPSAQGHRSLSSHVFPTSLLDSGHQPLRGPNVAIPLPVLTLSCSAQTRRENRARNPKK